MSAGKNCLLVALGCWTRITGKCLSKRPVLTEGVTTSVLLSSREEGIGEGSIYRCTVKASTVYAWLCSPPKAHARFCKRHTGRIKKREQGKEIAKEEKGKFAGNSVSLPGAGQTTCMHPQICRLVS